jgi:hypothetical protein
MPNPIAPISHHWLDSTHITFGVITGGLYTARWKAEASLFNGREPDEQRTDFDFGPLDSVSGRLWFLPTSALALQVSAGTLTEAEASESGGRGTDVARITASATYQAPMAANNSWATTVAWGHNEESGSSSNAFLAETSLTLQDRETWFGRFEAAAKTAHDLATAESADDFTVAKLQGGYTHYLAGWHGLKAGLGAAVSVGVVPGTLKAVYGSRTNVGFGVFMTLRPAMMTHEMPAGMAMPMDHTHHVP